jgi:SAM-dependent methyltransferase
VESSASPPRYPFDNTASQARTRLASLSTIYDEATFRHLDRLGIGPGWTCLEVGAGAGSVAAFMGDRVGQAGAVVATDINTDRLTEPMPAMVEVRRHDIGLDPLPHAVFDVIHARAVLSFVPRRRAALTRLTEALKPGGWILVEELHSPTVGPTVCSADPGPELARRARQAIIDILRRNGADLDFAFELPGTMADCGLRDIGAEGFFLPFRTDAVAALTRANIDQLQPQIIEMGAMSAVELDCYRDLLASPELPYPTSMALISVWGRRDLA